MKLWGQQPRPEWIEICSIHHSSGKGDPLSPRSRTLKAAACNIINFACIPAEPVVREEEMTSIGLTTRYFDLDPVPDADFATGALRPRWCCHQALDSSGYAQLSRRPPARKGSTSTRRSCAGWTQKEPWSVAKALARESGGSAIQKLIPAEYKIAKRPAGRVLDDYNQNAWGHHCWRRSYSVRPKPRAPVSTPVTLDQVVRGDRDRRLPRRHRAGWRMPRRRDLPALSTRAIARGRFDLGVLLRGSACAYG